MLGYVRERCNRQTPSRDRWLPSGMFLMTKHLILRDGQPAGIQPVVDRFEAYERSAFRSASLRDLLGRPGLLQLPLQFCSQLGFELACGYTRSSSLCGRGFIARIYLPSIEFTGDRGVMATKMFSNLPRRTTESM